MDVCLGTCIQKQEIDGMTCEGRAPTVKTAIRQVSGAMAADIDYDKRTIRPLDCKQRDRDFGNYPNIGERRYRVHRDHPLSEYIHTTQGWA